MCRHGRLVAAAGFVAGGRWQGGSRDWPFPSISATCPYPLRRCDLGWVGLKGPSGPEATTGAPTGAVLVVILGWRKRKRMVHRSSGREFNSWVCILVVVEGNWAVPVVPIETKVLSGAFFSRHVPLTWSFKTHLLTTRILPTTT